MIKQVAFHQNFREICDILSKYFIFQEITLLTNYYRHRIIHDETPTVDWPKEQQANIIEQCNKKDGAITILFPIYALQAPDFSLDELVELSSYVWKQFVEGTNLLGNFLREKYYTKI